MTPARGALSPLIGKLDATHDVDSFACGKFPLDRFLKRFASIDRRADSFRTYAACQGSTGLAYYSLAVGSVERSDAPIGVGRGWLDIRSR